MPFELKNANITHVSLVNKGANGKQFAIIKSDEKPTIQKHVPILKTDEEKRLVTGVVYEPNVEDAHGDFMTEEEIEKSAHTFMKEYQEIDKQHNWEGGYGKVVESWVAKADTYVGEQLVTKGSWCMTVYVEDDPTWEEIKKGDITGFSMGGKGERVEVEKGYSEDEKSFIRKMMDFFGHGNNIQKGEVKDRFNTGKQRRNLFFAKELFDDIFYDQVWSSTFDVSKIIEGVQDLVDIITHLQLDENNIVKAFEEIRKQQEQDEFLFTQIEKAGKVLSQKNINRLEKAIETLIEIKAEAEGEEIEVKKEELEQIIKEAVQPINEKVASLEKAINGEEEIKDDVQKSEDGQEDILKGIGELIKKELSPLSDRIEKLENAKGIRKSFEGQDEVEKAEQPKNVWAGLSL